MPDLETTALIERLQQSNRRWKRLALSLLAALGLAFVLLTTSAAEFQKTIRKSVSTAITASGRPARTAS